MMNKKLLSAVFLFSVFSIFAINGNAFAEDCADREHYN